MNVAVADINKDLDGLRTIASKAFSNTPDSDLSDWFDFNEMIKAIDEDRVLCIKAEEDGSIVGMTYAQQESIVNGKEGREKWVIVIAGVDPDHSGKGIGSSLLKELENQLTKRGILKLFVYTNKDDQGVINFYKKNGYQDAGWIKDYQYGRGNSALFLLKYLN
jgi:ribosomal protein S18 acetylase RimI-like enzyme